MSELTPDQGYPEAAKERRSSSFSEAHLEKVSINLSNSDWSISRY